MNEQVREQEAGGGFLLWVAIALALAGVVAFYMLGNQPTWIRWLAVAAGVGLGALVFGLSARGRDFMQFVVEARSELRKVFWPTRQETWMTTAVVFGFAVIAGVFFWVLDLLLAWATRTLAGLGG
ncbi:MAG: preprotein translocase subunit SecE [Pseudomonadota bacterium]